jgi:hypothetical protein
LDSWTLAEGDHDEVVVLLDAVVSLEGRDLLGTGQAVVYVEDEHATLGWDPGFQLLKAIADVDTGWHGVYPSVALDCPCAASRSSIFASRSDSSTCGN